MFSTSPLREDGGDDTELSPAKPSQRREERWGQKRTQTQSPNVRPSNKRKMQKFPEGQEEDSPRRRQPGPVETRQDTLICGLNREPSAGKISGMRPLPNGHSHTGPRTVLRTPTLEGLEVDLKDYVDDTSTLHTNGPSADLSDLTPSGESSECQDGIGVVEVLDIITHEPSEEEEEEEVAAAEEDQGSGNIVEHILKELRGINKIQEEISDLRHYLSSVRGSVDEVSCCVDAVLSEIGELYSGASAGPPVQPPPRPRTRRGSLGRQNATTALNKRATSPVLAHLDWDKDSVHESPHVSPKQWRERPSSRHPEPPHQDQSDHSSDVPPSSGAGDPPSLSLYSQECPSTSSLSSCQSSSCLDRDAWYGSSGAWRGSWASTMQRSVSGETGWSEEDLRSRLNSREEMRTPGGTGSWERYGTEETSSTPGLSTPNSSSSEHLSLLFGQQQQHLRSNSPSSSSSLQDWRPTRLQGGSGILECDCAANCPYSRSSGYHTVDAYADELASGPSRSLSRSTVLLTDCDDGYLDPATPYLDGCPSPTDTLDAGSEECLEREWLEPGGAGDDVDAAGWRSSEPANPRPEEHRPEEPRPAATAGFDVKSISKAVLTFKSALKGALRKLEVSSPECPRDDSESEAIVAKASPASCSSATLEETRTPQRLSAQPRPPSPLEEHSEESVYVDCRPPQEEATVSPHASPVSQSLPTPTEYLSMELSDSRGQGQTDGELSNPDLTPDHSPGRQHPSPGPGEQSEHRLEGGQLPGQSPLLQPVSSPETAGLSSIGEERASDQTEVSQVDPGHRERLANFQRVLKEKKQTRRRLSKTQGSTFSEDEFNQGTITSTFS